MDLELITIIVAATALVIGLVDLFLIRSMKKANAELVQMMEEREKTVMLNHMLIPFENAGGSPETIEEGVRSIAKIMKDSLVTKYDIKNAATVKELVEEIKKVNTIDTKLKEEILEFFDRIAYTIYSDDISTDSVKNIKNQALDIISKLNLEMKIPKKPKEKTEKG